MISRFVTRARYNDLRAAHADLKVQMKQEVGDLQCGLSLTQEANIAAIAKRVAAELEAEHLRQIVARLEHMIGEMRSDALAAVPVLRELRTYEGTIQPTQARTNLVTDEVPNQLEDSLSKVERRARATAAGKFGH